MRFVVVKWQMFDAQRSVGSCKNRGLRSADVKHRETAAGSKPVPPAVDAAARAVLLEIVSFSPSPSSRGRIP